MRKGLTAIEVVVAIVAVLVIAAVVLVPFLGRTHVHSPMLKESVNLRNIHMGMVTYATTNKDYLPGLTAAGDYIGKPFQGEYYGAMSNANNAAEEASGDGCTVSTGTNLALAIVLDDCAAVPAQLISPGETGLVSGGVSKSIIAVSPDAVAGTKVAPAGPGHPAVLGEVRDENFSFSMLAYGKPNLKTEWKANQNQQACVLATRLIFNAKSGAFNTVWTDMDDGVYKGSVVRGDCSTSTERFKSGDLATSANPFASLRYGPITNPTFTPATESTTTVGIFGRSNDMKNFDATPATGMLGSMND